MRNIYKIYIPVAATDDSVGVVVVASAVGAAAHRYHPSRLRHLHNMSYKIIPGLAYKKPTRKPQKNKREKNTTK